MYKHPYLSSCILMSPNLLTQSPIDVMVYNWTSLIFFVLRTILKPKLKGGHTIAAALWAS